MSDATYRIDVSHDPHNQTWPWDVRIVRLSDERLVTTMWAETHDQATEKAQRWLVEESLAQQGFSVYVNDAGVPVEGHSVKA